jgi:hypothetical protein
MSRRPHPRVSRTVRGRAPVAGAVATTAAALLGFGAPAASAAETCGRQAVMQLAIDHINTAHLERSPFQQVRDLFSIDSYVLAHTVLIESMIAPVLPTAEGIITPLEDHIKSAHLERSPVQQVQDLMKTDDYVLAHTVLVESMLSPALDGCGAPAAPPMPPMPGHGSPAPAEPSAGAGAATGAAGADTSRRDSQLRLLAGEPHRRARHVGDMEEPRRRRPQRHAVRWIGPEVQVLRQGRDLLVHVQPTRHVRVRLLAASANEGRRDRPVGRTDIGAAPARGSHPPVTPAGGAEALVSRATTRSRRTRAALRA